VVVDSHRQDLLGTLLTNDVLVENAADFLRRRELVRAALGLCFLDLFTNDVIAQVDALVADEKEGPAINLRTSCWLLPQKEQ